MHNLKHSARGASTLEYALLLALLAVMVIAVLASSWNDHFEQCRISIVRYKYTERLVASTKSARGYLRLAGANAGISSEIRKLAAHLVTV